jgi:LysM repeat protein
VLRWTTPPDDPDFDWYCRKATPARSKRGRNSTGVEEVCSISHGGPNKRCPWSPKVRLQRRELVQANNLSSKKPLESRAVELMIPMSGTGPASVSVGDDERNSFESDLIYSSQRRHSSSVCEQILVSTANLKEWNHLTSERLTVGKRLVVAAPSPSKKIIHKVQSGETLDKIASNYKTTVDAIISWNITNDLSVIHPGDQITIFLGNR